MRLPVFLTFRLQMSLTPKPQKYSKLKTFLKAVWTAFIVVLPAVLDTLFPFIEVSLTQKCIWVAVLAAAWKAYRNYQKNKDKGKENEFRDKRTREAAESIISPSGDD